MHTLTQLLSGELKGAKHLKLSCGLTKIPEEIFSLAESLEILDLSLNRLSALPDDFGRLSKLKIAFFSENLFTEFPSVLANCKALSMIGFKSNQIEYIPEEALPITTRWLILTNNRIKELPKTIGKCLLLQKVALAGNALSSLPPEMANCRNLELLRVSANKLTVLPDWLLSLPKLSWLAYAGNSFSYVSQSKEILREISWNEVELFEQLGEGASGNIYKAVWHRQNKTIQVAVKLFKGEVTSDGFPQDEMQGSIAAGTHQNLVALQGKLKDHPDQKQGLVMDLIPQSFKNLGLPPSMDTCTRDTFQPGTVFTSGQILKIVTAIASTACHLHNRGLMHGDMYAHNILIDQQFNSLIGDFGAASFYRLDDPMAEKIQQIEVRAFGCLLEDLLMHLHPDENNQKITEELILLKEEAMEEGINRRPLFDKIFSQLSILNNDVMGQ